MSHPLFDVTEFAIVANYTLFVRFDDGTAQTIDFEPVLGGEMLGPLRDPETFRQVRLDPETKTLTWPSGADFDPYVLHEWSRIVASLDQSFGLWANRVDPPEDGIGYMDQMRRGNRLIESD